MAEGEGFEPPVPFRAQRFSRPPVSTAHASLRDQRVSIFISLQPPEPPWRPNWLHRMLASAFIAAILRASAPWRLRHDSRVTLNSLCRLQRRAAAFLILRLPGFLDLCEAGTTSALRNPAALLRGYRLQRRTFVPGFARPVSSLGILLFHTLIGSANPG